MKKNAPLERYRRQVAANGKQYFVLFAANKEPIGTSEMYSSQEAMEHGIAAVKRVAPTAAINDLTA